MCTRVCLPQGPLSLCLCSFLRCDTLYALLRDCLATVILTTITDITSTVGSGATVSTIREKLRWSSVVKMTNRTVLGHIPLAAVFSNNNKSGGIKRLCLMIRRENQIGGVKHMCRVITLKSRSGVGDGPHLLMRWIRFCSMAKRDHSKRNKSRASKSNACYSKQWIRLFSATNMTCAKLAVSLTRRGVPSRL